MDAQEAAHRPHREPLLIQDDERVLHFTSLVKYAVTF
jgi:hypothetical protein